jgi:hypothetical protein
MTRVPDLTQPAFGWRMWVVPSINEPYLMSWNGSLWRPGERLTAVCAAGIPHGDVPDRHCGCGFYGVWDPVACWSTPAFGVPHIAFGRFAGWGKCCEHTRGFRAQYAKPVSPLFLDGRIYPEWACRALAVRYHILVLVRHGTLALPVEHLAGAYEQVRCLGATAPGARVRGFEVIAPAGLGDEDLLPWTATPHRFPPPDPYPPDRLQDWLGSHVWTTTLCQFGWHRWTEVLDHDGQETVGCSWCGRRKEPQ